MTCFRACGSVEEAGAPICPAASSNAGDRAGPGARSQDRPARRAVRGARAGHCPRSRARLSRTRAAGQTIVLVEQNTAATLALANRVYIINNGHIVHEGPAREIKAHPEMLQRYLGV